VTPFVTGGAGFLLAVLWFDLMFDVQVVRHRSRGGPLPDEVLASIAGYYRRVTTAARPMNRLVALVMVATVATVVVQLVRGELPTWASVSSLALILAAVSIAATSTVPSAVRLGARADGVEEQSRLARSILRDHVLCAAGIGALLAIQLSVG
jgi:hypothetical protein